MERNEEIFLSTIQIEDNLKRVKDRINSACHTAGRDPKEVKLLLATKTVSAGNINRAIDFGETLIGESRAQELQKKYPHINHDQAETHFIGHLQTNKVNSVLRHVSFIHSVDRLRLAQRLHRRLTNEKREIDILIQVNTSYEESKFGVAPEKTLNLIEQLAEFDTLHIKGLMTIGKLSADPKEARKCFRLLKSIQQQIQAQNYPGVEMDVLSMGMSADFDVAIEEGATIVRVGTAIFGERIYPDSYYWNEQAPISD